MIQGFFNTVQNDVTSVYQYFTSSQPANEEQKNRVILATIRIFAALMIARACLYALYALSNVSSNILMEVSIAVAQFVLAHDVFLLARNVKTPTSPFNCVKATIFGIYVDIMNLKNRLTNTPLLRYENIIRVPEYRETVGTFLRPIWNKLIAYQYPNSDPGRIAPLNFVGRAN